VLARRSVIIMGFLAAGLFTIPIILVHDLTTAAICLSLAFFFAEWIVGPIWLCRWISRRATQVRRAG